MRDAATSQNGLSLLAGQATVVCHGHDAVTAEQTPCIPWFWSPRRPWMIDGECRGWHNALAAA